jgi:LL-H family phage holin
MYQDLIIKIISDIVYVLALVFISYGIALIKKKIGTEKITKIEQELRLKQGLAYDAVKFVEQAYVDLHGKDKLEQAVNWVCDRLHEKGIEINEDEIEGLVESALRGIKDAYGENWVAK